MEIQGMNGLSPVKKGLGIPGGDPVREYAPEEERALTLNLRALSRVPEEMEKLLQRVRRQLDELLAACPPERRNAEYVEASIRVVAQARRHKGSTAPAGLNLKPVGAFRRGAQTGEFQGARLSPCYAVARSGARRTGTAPDSFKL